MTAALQKIVEAYCECYRGKVPCLWCGLDRPQWTQVIAEAVAEEREACARVVEGYEPDYGSDLCGRIAAAIRARKGGLK